MQIVQFSRLSFDFWIYPATTLKVLYATKDAHVSVGVPIPVARGLNQTSVKERKKKSFYTNETWEHVFKACLLPHWSSQPIMFCVEQSLSYIRCPPIRFRILKPGLNCNMSITWQADMAQVVATCFPTWTCHEAVLEVPHSYRMGKLHVSPWLALCYLCRIMWWFTTWTTFYWNWDHETHFTCILTVFEP